MASLSQCCQERWERCQSANQQRHRTGGEPGTPSGSSRAVLWSDLDHQILIDICNAPARLMKGGGGTQKTRANTHHHILVVQGTAPSPLAQASLSVLCFAKLLALPCQQQQVSTGRATQENAGDTQLNLKGRREKDGEEKEHVPDRKRKGGGALSGRRVNLGYLKLSVTDIHSSSAPWIWATHLLDLEWSLDVLRASWHGRWHKQCLCEVVKTQPTIRASLSIKCLSLSPCLNCWIGLLCCFFYLFVYLFLQGTDQEHWQSDTGKHSWWWQLCGCFAASPNCTSPFHASSNHTYLRAAKSFRFVCMAEVSLRQEFSQFPQTGV